MTKSFYNLNELNFQETKALFKKVFARYPYIKKLLATYKYAKKAHGKQLRQHLPVPYIVHMLRMCIILYQFHGIKDLDLLQATLLHDVVEDTKITQSEIEKNYNARVAEIVKALTRIKPKNETPLEKYQNKQEKLKKIMKRSKEIRILKAVDLTDNMNDWIHITKNNPMAKKIPRWLAEAKNQYFPLAKSLGKAYLAPMEHAFKILINKGFQPNSINPKF